MGTLIEPTKTRQQGFQAPQQCAALNPGHGATPRGPWGGSGPNPAPRAGIIMCFTVTRGGVKFCMEAAGAGSAFARREGHLHESPLFRGGLSQDW